MLPEYRAKKTPVLTLITRQWREELYIPAEGSQPDALQESFQGYLDDAGEDRNSGEVDWGEDLYPFVEHLLYV